MMAPGHRRTLSSTLIDESVAAAAELVQRWHPDTPTTSTTSSLFLHSHDHSLFLGATADLHRAMLFFASTAAASNNSGSIIQAQELLQTAMRRLDLELRLLLHHLDDDDDHHILQGQAATPVTTIIRSIVRAMMAAGYGKECLSTFKSSRRAALAAKLQRLLPGHKNSYSSSLNKLAWDQVDARIIQPWLAAAAIAFNSIFAAEKELCDAVFAGDHAAGVGEAVFAAIADNQATDLLAVAEAAVARARRAPERLFRVLDVHNTLAAEVLPAIQSVFVTTNNKGHHGDSSAVATRAALVIAKAAEAARGTLAGFEAAILHKEPSKATTPGGAVHPLTRYVMNYLVFLADYEDDEQQQLVDTSAWICRLVSSLLSKLESKAGSYREAALSYLFLANNTHYVATKVRGSSKLQAILGEGWAEAHGAKARGHVQVFVRAAWSKVLTMISFSPSHEAGRGGAEEGVEAAVMEAVAMQDQWMAADDEMAQALRLAATAAVVPKYRMFYRRYGAAVSLTPGDVTTMIAALFTSSTGQQPEDPNAIPQRVSSFSPDALARR